MPILLHCASLAIDRVSIRRRENNAGTFFWGKPYLLLSTPPRAEAR
jgi:hypothetical protein